MIHQSGIKHKVRIGFDEDEVSALVVDTIHKVLKSGNNYPVEITFATADKSRTSAQNRFLWLMFSQIAVEMGRITNYQYTYTKNDAHDLLLQSLRGVKKRMIGNTEVISQVKTENMTEGEVAELITECLAWAAQRKMNVMLPEEYQAWARAAR